MKTTKVEADAVKGFASPDVCRLLGVPSSTLSKWANDELVTPTLLDTTGRRSTRYWTPEDYVLIQVIKALRDSGCRYELISEARPLLSEVWDGLGDDEHFYWNGNDVVEVVGLDHVVSQLREPGQFLIHYVATPLRAWLTRAESQAHWYLRSDYERLKVLRATIRSVD